MPSEIDKSAKPYCYVHRDDQRVGFSVTPRTGFIPVYLAPPSIAALREKVAALETNFGNVNGNLAAKAMKMRVLSIIDELEGKR